MWDGDTHSFMMSVSIRRLLVALCTGCEMRRAHDRAVLIMAATGLKAGARCTGGR